MPSSICMYYIIESLTGQTHGHVFRKHHIPLCKTVQCCALSSVPQSYGVPPGECHYCSSLNHSITNCPAVAEDLGAGRIVQNDEGRVILPNGSYVPRAMAGNNMHERVTTWHKTYPGHLAANLLSLSLRGDLYNLYDPSYDGYSSSDVPRFALSP